MDLSTPKTFEVLNVRSFVKNLPCGYLALVIFSFNMIWLMDSN